MASDLIYREDAKVFVRHACYKKINPIDYLDEVPAADVRPVVRGTWVPTRKYDYYYKCSVCNKIGPLEPDAESAFQYDYCPNCGADMREPNLDTTKGERRDESSG